MRVCVQCTLGVARLHDSYTVECKDPHMECGDIEGILPIVARMLMRRME